MQGVVVGINIAAGMVTVCDKDPARCQETLRAPASSIGFSEVRAGCVEFGLGEGGHNPTKDRDGGERGGEIEQAGEDENEDRGHGLGHGGFRLVRGAGV